MTSRSRLFGLIPAAGSGERFAARDGDIPKQYRNIGRGSRASPVLMHSVRSLLAAPQVDMVFIVLAPGDEHFRRLDWSEVSGRIQPLYCGGGSRRDSVLNGLVATAGAVEPEDWILVHDAARPCLPARLLQRLIYSVLSEQTGENSAAGGILAVPVTDTLKRGDKHNGITGTQAREGLWQAQTPQMFRHALLLRALAAAPDVTDESAAIESLGLKTRLVPGSPMNIKVTVPDDLALAERLLGEADPLYQD